MLTPDQIIRAAELIKAMREGKRVEYRLGIVQTEDVLLYLLRSDNGDDLRILDAPKMRPMTHDEKVGLIVNTPGMVIRDIVTGNPYPPKCYYSVDSMEWWNTMDIDGHLLGEWRKFEKEDV